MSVVPAGNNTDIDLPKKAMGLNMEEIWGWLIMFWAPFYKYYILLINNIPL